jgi:UDP:flavonoid glycosyltransferase YjiC (YdhE family)
LIVCLPNCGYLSETSRMVAIYRALEARGAAVSMATHGGSHLHVLDDEGIPYDILPPIVDEARSRSMVADGPGIGSPRQSIWTDDEIRRSVATESDYFATTGATAVVTGFQLTTLLSSRLARIPLATSHAGSWVPPVFERGMLPTMDQPSPGFLRHLPKAIGRALANSGPSRIKLHLGGFNRVAAEMAIEPVPSFAALLCGDLTLVTEAPEILGISDSEMSKWRPGSGFRAGTRMRYAGPIFAKLRRPIPDRVVEFLKAPGDVAYVALTSSSPDLVRHVVGAVEAAGLRALVASTVHDLSNLASERVMVEPFLPSHAVMPEASVAVVTGGQGSVQTALASATPFVGIPLQPEQEWNVHVAATTGAGRKVSPRNIRRDLTNALTVLQGDGVARRAAAQVADVYSRIDGPGKAAQAIIEVVAAGSFMWRD